MTALPSDPRMRGFRERTEVVAVLSLLEERIATTLPAETTPLLKGHGRVLAEDVASPVDVPSFDRSAMDGYALRGEETFGATEYAPIPFRVVGESLPGRPFDGEVTRGDAVRITTGAPVPPGADAVLMAEHAREEEHEQGARVHATQATTPGKHLSPRGEDVREGSTLLSRGRALRPQDIGLLSSCGIHSLPVHRRPSVEIVVTGPEVLRPGSEPQPHRIIDANSPMLTGLVARDGGTSTVTSGVEDDRAVIGATLQASRADVILVTGGTSVGPEDHVPEVVRNLGELPVHGIAMRPSSPTGIGFLGERPIFLLPGNPVSALAAYEFFAGPTLRFLGGRSREWPHPQVELPLRHKLTSVTGRVDYARVAIVDGEVEPRMTSGASILSSTTRADGCVIVPQDVEGISAGQRVTVHLYG